MKVGISTGYYSAIEADVEIPQIVVDFMKNAQDVLKHEEAHVIKCDRPVVKLDTQGGHGPDNPGIIITESIKDKTDQHNCQYEVTARASFGSEKPHLSRNEFDLWDPNNFNRLHLSIIGKRSVYPSDYFKRMGQNRSGKVDVIGTLNEKVNFSMRWVGGEFQTQWNEEEVFNKDRTTYLKFMDMGGGTCYNGGEEAIREYIEGIGLREPLLESVAEESHKPVKGYEPVLDFLSGFGEVTPDDAGSFVGHDSDYGSWYLTEKVLPAMVNYVKA